MKIGYEYTNSIRFPNIVPADIVMNGRLLVLMDK